MGTPNCLCIAGQPELKSASGSPKPINATYIITNKFYLLLAIAIKRINCIKAKASAATYVSAAAFKTFFDECIS